MGRVLLAQAARSDPLQGGRSTLDWSTLTLREEVEGWGPAEVVAAGREEAVVLGHIPPGAIVEGSLLVRTRARRNGGRRRNARLSPGSRLEVVDTGPNALPGGAPCLYFGQCGGCSSQNVAYEAQLRLKEDLVRFHVGEESAEKVHPILPSPNTFRCAYMLEMDPGEERYRDTEE